MIERTNAFKVGDQSFLTLADAQKFELGNLYGGDSIGDKDSVVSWIMINKVKILDILTTTSASKPKARKINGGSKPRKVVLPTVSSPVVGIKDLSKVILTGPNLDS